MRKWRKSNYQEETLNKLKQQLNIPETSLKILVKNGFENPEEIERFIGADIRQIDFSHTMKDSDKAVDLLWEKIKKNEKIAVFGDYDCDGINATVVAVRLLQTLGADVTYYINDRVTEGYGMCESGIDKILQTHPDTKLIVTVDNGISAFEQIKYAKSKGLEVVVTDHHEVVVENGQQQLPDADAIVNPKRKDDESGLGDLCGAAVVWRVLGYLFLKQKRSLNPVYKTLDFVALATVGDVVSMRFWENRAIVKAGLLLLNKKPRPLFDLMTNIMEVRGEVTEETLGFQFAPLTNAVGRMERNVNTLVATFLSDKPTVIYERLQKCKEINDQRKELSEEQMNIVEEQIDLTQKILIVSAPGLKEGIIGLIAGRLKEIYNKPVIVFSETPTGEYKGSARSVECFPIKENLDKCKQYILRYGGHPLAAGLSVSKDCFETFKTAITDLANETIKDEDLIKTFEYVDVLDSSHINQEIYESVSQLRPFGQNFSSPYFKMVFDNIFDYLYIGKPEPTHLKLKTKDGVTIIGWRLAEKYAAQNMPKSVMLLGSVDVNNYNDTISYQVKILGDNLAPMK